MLRLEVRMLREEVARLWVVERRGKEEQGQGNVQEEQSNASKCAPRIRVLPFPHPSAALSVNTVSTLEPIVFTDRTSTETKDKETEVVKSKSVPHPDDQPQNSTNVIPNILTQILLQVKVASRVHCDHCDKTYTTENRLKKHMENVHKDLMSETANLPSSTSSNKIEAPTKLFECPLCDWKGATAGVVKTHVKKKHM